MYWLMNEGEERRDWIRGWKTVEDQGVPWTKTRVLRALGFEVLGGVGGVRREYLIVQLAWWKVEGRLWLRRGAGALERDIFSL